MAPALWKHWLPWGPAASCLFPLPRQTRLPLASPTVVPHTLPSPSQTAFTIPNHGSLCLSQPLASSTTIPVLRFPYPTNPHFPLTTVNHVLLSLSQPALIIPHHGSLCLGVPVSGNAGASSSKLWPPWSQLAKRESAVHWGNMARCHGKIAINHR